MWRLLVPVVYAQGELRRGLNAAQRVGLPDEELPDLILRIINWSLTLAAVIALGFIVYGGFRYIISRGEERDVENAKNTITYAVIGLVVLGIAALLVNFVISAVLGTSQTVEPPLANPRP